MEQKETTISERLQSKYKEEIIELANLLSIKIKKSDKKGAIVTTVVEAILEQPMILLSKLSRDYLLHLQKMVHDPKHSVALSLYIHHYSLLYSNGFTDIKIEKDVLFEFVSEDFANAVLPFIDKMVEDASHSSKYEIEQLIIGLLNIYGVLDINVMTSFLNDMGANVTQDYFSGAKSESMTLTDCYMREIDLFISPFMRKPSEIVEEQSKRQIHFKSTFTKEEVLSMGNVICPVPLSKETTELKQYLLAKGVPQSDIDAIISNIWGKSNNDNSGFNFIAEVYQSVVNKFKLNIEPQSFFDILIRYVNAIPKWILNGYSSNELGNQTNNDLPKQAPMVIAGPNMKQAGMEINQAEVDRMWNERDTPQTNKVGRNDPCPCGSGKKYKKCCGDN